MEPVAVSFYSVLLAIPFILALFSFWHHHEKYSPTRNFIYSISIFFFTLVVIFFVATLNILEFTLWESAAIGIIGANDGPSTIFVGNKFAYNLFYSIYIPLIIIISIISTFLLFFYKYNWHFGLKSIFFSLFFALFISTILFTFSILCFVYI